MNHTENVKIVQLYSQTGSRRAQCHLRPVHSNTRTSHHYSKSPLGPITSADTSFSTDFISDGFEENWGISILWFGTRITAGTSFPQPLLLRWLLIADGIQPKVWGCLVPHGKSDFSNHVGVFPIVLNLSNRIRWEVRTQTNQVYIQLNQIFWFYFAQICFFLRNAILPSDSGKCFDLPNCNWYQARSSDTDGNPFTYIFLFGVFILP